MRITKTVGQYYFGSGTLDQLEVFVDEQKQSKDDVAIYFIDYFFADGQLEARLPLTNSDILHYVDTTDEPSTDGIDSYTAKVVKQLDGRRAAIVIGIGGGATLDTAKAVSNLLNNDGKAADYQGWDLVPNKGVFKVGVPTLSGTGAEASRTCVMMNPVKNLKLGMNSDHTVFDRLILDPDLSKTVEREQFFYTGMDTYIHCIESLKGNFRHAVADTYSRAALDLCREIFLSNDMMADENREKMMVASYLGGSAIGNSYVGVVHPLSAGLSMALHTHHCIGNCLVMNVMEEFYPEETAEFHKMMERQNISLPQNLCKTLPEDMRDVLYDGSIIHEKPLINALGDNFKDVLTRGKVFSIFDRI